MELTLECKTRPENAKPNAIRRGGQIPAVLYGHNGTESVALVVEGREAERLMKKAVINNTVITVNVPEISWSGKTLLREVQTHPSKGSLYHLSFFSFAAHGSIDIKLPIHFVGISEGVKSYGGMLDTVINELPVQGQPDRMPDFIEVDVTNMAVGDAINVGALNLPEGVQTQLDPETIIVSVLQGRPDAGAAAE
ncbi:MULTISPECIES: 50S ribosomal protein L25/general stress protein Ctc [unclassified Leptolyngbya]|uniref:50S ribosomal protein L25/general stress protein Ctc n=1 Tax=unclassified Leptolyngbya TaxID=2650499 RepID=UPI001686499D|nr:MULTISPECIES: 50S ribosomal protein L25/general stress protein Ctc [unclassified Leptolyngbya]MBD1913028.1 50S ribosomal protein L25/general stress protein Ctc [Leptolyngbya sp. FACHB-8]MBD2154471.1 50S ribosomal protein L25/general stress protein Ctc [Leptolyngbya sp. FACHB-16]